MATRGARRLVIGNAGEIYYTDDHYLTFQKISEQYWDALEECITDLDWCPAARYILIYDYPEAFSKAEPEQWKIAYDILRSAVEYWQEMDMPLEVLLIGES